MIEEEEAVTETERNIDKMTDMEAIETEIGIGTSIGIEKIDMMITSLVVTPNVAMKIEENTTVVIIEKEIEKIENEEDIIREKSIAMMIKVDMAKKKKKARV